MFYLTDRIEIIIVFDLIEKRIVAAVMDAGIPLHGGGILFHAGERFAIIPRFGKAVIFTSIQTIGTIGDDTTAWRWGEDGSAWSLHDTVMDVLLWREGEPRFRKLTGSARNDTWVGLTQKWSLYDGDPFRWTYGPAWGAVWQDGVQMARTAMIGTRHRRLSYYRGNKLIGTFTLRWNTPTQKQLRLALSQQHESSAGPPDWSVSGVDMSRERLAFSADGSRLVWIVDDGEKPMTIYTFATGWQPTPASETTLR